MLRTSNGAEYLYDVFKRLNKPVTRENAAKLCALACNQPELFQHSDTPVVARQAVMLRDIVDMYRLSRGLSMWSVYVKLARNVLAQYDVSTYTNEELLEAIFTAIDDKIAQIEKLLADDGFPSMLGMYHA